MNTNEKMLAPYSGYPDQGFNEQQAPDVTAWKLARSAIEHENHLINHRLTWFFSTQGFLLSAFFFLLSQADKPELTQFGVVQDIPLVSIVIGLLAIYMGLATRYGILRASHAIKDINEHYDNLKALHRFSRTPPLHHKRPANVFSASAIPLIMAIMWMFIEIFCAVVRIPAVAAFLNGLDPDKVMLTAGLTAAGAGACIIAYSMGVNKRLSSEK
jgi:hypothetical protein